MGKKKIGIILGAIAVAAVSAAGIWYFLGNQGRDSNDRVYVEKVSAVMGNVTGAQNRYSGVVQPQETVEVKADSERTIAEVLVEVGDTVEEGTPLFRYDTEDLTLELEQAKLELQNQDIEISNYRSQITELDKERKAAAEGDKFEYTTQIQTLETQIKQAEFEKSSKKLEMEKIQKKVDNSQVTSNTSGMIKSINDGTNTDKESSAFITILSSGEYRIKGIANEQNIGTISPDAEVIVRSRVDESITWSGVVESLNTEETDKSSEDDNMMMGSDDSMGMSSSDYSFFVTLDETDGLMLGQHVLIELDQGQTEEKEGIWLYSGYIAFDQAEGGFSENLNGSTEMMDMGMMDYGTEQPYDYEDDAEWFDDLEYDTEWSDDLEYGTEWVDDFETGTELMPDGAAQSAYVWADDGTGRLEKRAVELGEYDMELDKYEILSGLSEDDLIAFPMEGLYEGVKTVTNMDEVDYSSGLYNQGTESMWEEGEYGDDADFNMDGDYSGEMGDGMEDGMDANDGMDGDLESDDGSIGEDNAGDDSNGDSVGGDDEASDGVAPEPEEKLDLKGFLKAEGIL